MGNFHFCLQGGIVRGNSVIDAQLRMENIAGHVGHPAPMPLLLGTGTAFQYKEALFANSEESAGIDVSGRFVRAGEAVVATYHGGLAGRKWWGLLSPRILEAAWSKGSYDEFHGVILADVYGDENVFSDYLEGMMPDGRNVPVYSYDELVEGKVPKYSLSAHIVVRPFETARCSSRKTYVGIDELADSRGEVNNQQLIVYAGGIAEAGDFVKRVKSTGAEGLGLYDPFGEKRFDPGQATARLLRLGADDWEGLEGYVNRTLYAEPSAFLYLRMFAPRYSGIEQMALTA